MNGSEKQIKWAEQIINSAISELDVVVQKYSDKFAKKPSNSNKSLLAEYQFHADLIKPRLIALDDAAKIIDCRSMIEKTKNCNQRTTWDFLHYVCGVKESDLPQIPESF